MRQTYGKLLPGMRISDLTGKLIVIEGTDGVGRTTQIDLLKPWLEELGHAVLDTGMARSTLAGEGLRRAKEGNNLGRVTQSLFYATDFIDRLENEIVPVSYTHLDVYKRQIDLRRAPCAIGPFNHDQLAAQIGNPHPREELSICLPHRCTLTFTAFSSCVFTICLTCVCCTSMGNVASITVSPNSETIFSYSFSIKP